MAEEFTIKSEQIESKINQLLPSQGGFGAGVDFSASTMVIPIVDLTETAEGSALRQDLQRALSHTNTTHTLIDNATTTLVNTTGYYQVDIAYAVQSETVALRNAKLVINDGTTDKTIWQITLHQTSNGFNANGVYQTVVFLGAGDSLIGDSDDDQVMLNVVTRQIADINGNLT
jgi:hypothetical protein